MGDSSDYSSSEGRSVDSLTELKPGDHIRVRGTKSGSSSSSSGSSSSSSGSSSASASNTNYERCDGKVITHHLLVVKAIDDTHVRVIHKVKEKGVQEEDKCYKPSDVTVLDYNHSYKGEKAIQRARERIGKKYNVATSNCEHFVTEVRTGKKESSQVKGAVGGGCGGTVAGVGTGAGVGALAGAGVGAAIGTAVFPLVGTAPGAAIGAIIGAVGAGAVLGGAGGGAAAFIGIKVANWWKAKKAKKKS